MVGSFRVEEVNVFQIGALEQHANKEKLDETQARLGLDFSNEPKGEIAYLKRAVKERHKLKENSEVELLKKFS